MKLVAQLQIYIYTYTGMHILSYLNFVLMACTLLIKSFEMAKKIRGVSNHLLFKR